jgi:endo-1,4-beta-mannosidase
MAEETLDAIARMGFSVIRLWAFNDGAGWSALQTAPGARLAFGGARFLLAPFAAFAIALLPTRTQTQHNTTNTHTPPRVRVHNNNNTHARAGVYDESVFRGLDWVVAEAGRRGLRLMMTLTNFWEDFGGLPQYVR